MLLVNQQRASTILTVSGVNVDECFESHILTKTAPPATKKQCVESISIGSNLRKKKSVSFKSTVSMRRIPKLNDQDRLRLFYHKDDFELFAFEAHIDKLHQKATTA